MWKRSSHPKDTTVHNHLDARSYKGYIVTGSSPVLTTKRVKVSHNKCTKRKL